jgi:DNA-binding CsgD family transcriptional regulator
MPRRGRWPYPDILTPREWEVLSLVREGLSNPQIAERLFISPDAAKYHVSEILSKLGVASREEAAAWQPEPAEAPVLRPAWARALGRWWPALAWGGATAVLAGLALLAVGVLRSNGDDGGSGVEATAISPGETVLVSPTASHAGPAPLTVTSSADLPGGISLIMQIGGGESPLAGIEHVNSAGDVRVLFYAGDRIVHSAAGAVSVLSDYEASGVALPSPAPDAPAKADGGVRPYINGLAISADARTMIVGLCVRGWCGGVPGVINEQAQTVLYRSTDGGDNWSELERLDSAALVQAIGGDGRALVGVPSANQKFQTHTWEPGGEPVPPQVVDASLGAGLNQTVTIGNGSMASVGSVGGASALVVESGGKQVAAYGVPGLEGVTAALSSTRFVGLVGAGSILGAPQGIFDVPVVIDLDARTVTPIAHPFMDGTFDVGFTSILAVEISVLP